MLKMSNPNSKNQKMLKKSNPNPKKTNKKSLKCITLTHKIKTPKKSSLTLKKKMLKMSNPNSQKRKNA